MGEELGEKSLQKESLYDDSDSVLERAKKLEKEIDSVKKRFQDKAKKETQSMDSILFDEDDCE